MTQLFGYLNIGAVQAWNLTNSNIISELENKGWVVGSNITVNNGLVFDGSNSDTAIVYDTLFNSTGLATIHTQIKTDKSSSVISSDNNYLFDMRDSSNNEYSLFRNGSVADRHDLYVNGSLVSSFTIEYSAEEEIFLTITLDADNDEWKVYKNGIECTLLGNYATSSVNSITKISVGQKAVSPLTTTALDGILQQFIILPIKLSSTEITNLINGTLFKISTPIFDLPLNGRLEEIQNNTTITDTDITFIKNNRGYYGAYFNGSSSQIQSEIDNVSAITISFKANFHETGQDDYLISKGYLGNSTGSWIVRKYSNDTIYFYTYDGSSWYNSIGYITKSEIENMHEDTMITITFNGTDKKMYVDGKLIRTVTYSTPINIYESNDSLLIGNNSGRRFGGVMYDVKIWNKVLTDIEILLLSKQKHNKHILVEDYVDNNVVFEYYNNKDLKNPSIIPVLTNVPTISLNGVTNTFNDVWSANNLNLDVLSDWKTLRFVWYPDGTSHYGRYIIRNDNMASETDKGFAVLYDSNNEYIEFRLGNGTERKIQKVLSQEPKKPYVIHWVYDGQTSYIYIDGVLVDSVSYINNSGDLDATVSMMIGGSGGYSAPGEVSNIKLWSDKKTQKEITKDFEKIKRTL